MYLSCLPSVFSLFMLAESNVPEEGGGNPAELTEKGEVARVSLALFFVLNLIIATREYDVWGFNSRRQQG